MFGKGLYYLLGAMLLTSCHFREIIPPEEYSDADKAKLDFYIDWSQLGQRPTGVTLCCYPSDVASTGMNCYYLHSNNVDHVYAELPDDDYAVICFNQSEEEFAKLKFDLNTFDDASVSIKSPEEYHGAIGSTLVIQPEDFAVATLASVKHGGTRGYNNESVLMPQPPIKPMQMDLYVIGLTPTVEVTGTLTNLSKGVTLRDLEPMEEVFDQKLEPSDWKIEVAKEEKKPGKLTTKFGTFGLPKKKGASRALTEESEARQILMLDFKAYGESLGHVDIDFTDVMKQQEEDIASGKREDYTVISGNPGTTVGEDEDDDAHVLPDGTILIKKPVKSSGVSVESWGDTTLIVLKL